MLDKPAQCSPCELARICAGFVPPWGNAKALIRFCGEAPGADEAVEGMPFVGESGRLLFNAMAVAQIPSKLCERCKGTGGTFPDTCNWCRGSKRDFSESVYVYNLVQCRPPNNDFSVIEENYGEINRCQKNYVAPAPEGSVTFMVGGKSLMWHFPGYTSVEVWAGSLLHGSPNS